MNCEDIARVCPLYLSGELDPPSALVFREHLEVCQSCAGEVKNQRRLDAALRSSVLSWKVDTATVDQCIRQHIASQRPISSLGRLAIAAGFVAMLLTGALGYRNAFAPELTRLCADAAQDHDSEVTRGQPRTWLSDPRAIADLAQRNGIAGSLVTALAPDGYELKRGKLCRLDGKIFLHLVYAQDTREFSTYLHPLDNRPLPAVIGGKSIHVSESRHEYVAYFQTASVTAVFVINQSSDSAMSIARLAARVL